MGFFNKIFGGTVEPKKLRTQFKNEKHFLEEIRFFRKMIKIYEEDDRKKLQNGGTISGQNYLSYCRKFLKVIECEYSLGKDNVEHDFKEAVSFFSKGWSEHYQGYPLLLQMVSFAILLDVEDGEMKKIKDFLKKAEESSIEEIWKPDSLIYFLIGENTERTGDTPYQKLYEISKLSKPEAESAIEKYLDKWYGMHKDDPWYNTHLPDKGYSGYWAWEVGAFVKVMGLDDSRFKDNIYYPYDMVHRKE
ncbi:DUF1911 domain-containing protein [Pedobacter jeongneungensis]|uniref:DUF1911 domain-containing protein n=1 Tax=Pedobacter jeongneungensis TaxID=947309 RepID=A0ABP8BK60_9SPHI